LSDLSLSSSRTILNSRRTGLIFDMIDSFKFADREELLLVVLDQGLTWRDFRTEPDRRGTNFYYPRSSAISKLDEIGAAADSLMVRYSGQAMPLGEAYRLFAKSLLGTLLNRESGFNPSTFEFPAEA